MANCPKIHKGEYENNMKNKLPFTPPKVTCYNQHANLLAIISQTDAYLPWFYNNYFQLQFTNDIYNKEVMARLDFEMPLLFEACPFLEQQTMNRIFIGRLWKDASSFVRECIDNKYYVYITIDTFYIDCYSDFQKHHGQHPILIFGYDTDIDSVFVADNFSGGRYAVKVIPITQFNQSYCFDKANPVDLFMDGVTLFKYHNHNQFWGWHHDYKFDRLFLKNTINDFLNSKGLNNYGILGIEQWKNTTLVYGKKCYDGINDYLDDMQYYDHRTFFVFWEHKKIMRERIEFLIRNHMLNSDTQFLNIFKLIEFDAIILQNLWVKYGLTHRESTLEQVRAQFNYIVERECVAFTQLYEAL